MALSPMKAILGLGKDLKYELTQVQGNAKAAIDAIIQQLNGANSYWSGYHGSTAGWSTTSNSFADFTPSGTAVLTPRQSSGLTVATAAGNLPGITFTPASGAIYLVTANCTYQLSSPVGNNANGALRLTDGVSVISNSPDFYKDSHLSAILQGTSITGIYVPSTAGAATLEVQGMVGGDPGYNLSLQYIGSAIEWTVVQIV